MQQEYEERYRMIIQELGRLKFFHYIQEYQWDYNNHLAGECQIEGQNGCVADLYKHVSLTRRQDILKYKNAVYRFTDDNQNFRELNEKP